MSFWNDIFDEIQRMQRETTSILEDLFPSLNNKSFLKGDIGSPKERPWRPHCDVKETDKEMVIQCDIPGCKKSDIKVELEERLLTITGKRDFSSKMEPDKGERFHVTERNYGSFSRSIYLKGAVSPEQIRARFQNGVLEVKFPKPEKPIVPTIPISD